jgi:hypothetical protein
LVFKVNRQRGIIEIVEFQAVLLGWRGRCATSSDVLIFHFDFFIFAGEALIFKSANALELRHMKDWRLA